MKEQLPKTKEGCFAMLDEMLRDEDKQSIKEMEDTIDLHFTLGMWIRNNWIYPQNQEFVLNHIFSFLSSFGYCLESYPIEITTYFY